MIPDNYKSPKGKTPGAEQMSDTTILEEIRLLRTELVDDMRELSVKIDGIASGHNDLRLEFVKTTAVMETRVAKLEKDITALWDHNRVMRSDVSKCVSDMETHKAVEQTTATTKKGVAEWVRWIPGVLIGMIGLIAAMLR